MLDKEDVKVIKELLNEQSAALRSDFDAKLKDQSRDLRDFVRQEDAALENRILKGVSEILHEAIAPRIDDHEVRIHKLENHSLLNKA